MNNKTIYILLYLSFVIQPNYSQTNRNDTDIIAEELYESSKQTSLDLVYLQTSKGVYETGEDVWFKGYILDAQYFSPSGRSKILFVQLIEDKTDVVVWEEKYEIENGFVDGRLLLNESLQAGTYTLAAYSSHSFHKDTKDFNAIRKLEVLKNIKNKTKPVRFKKDSIIYFTTFPEGGNLISGIQSRIAFKALNLQGLPIEVSFTLFENNIALSKFKSSHAGMGSFSFTPDINKKYHIELTEPASQKAYSLGQIHEKGKVLQLVRSTKEFLSFKVSQSDTLKKENVYLRLQMRGVVYIMAKGALKKDLIFKILLKDIPQGIAEVTLFNENSEPMAERLVYVNQDQKLNIKAILDKSEYTTREKTILKIKVTDLNDQPISAHLGLSVYDRLYENKLDSKNILTHFYLSTQLNGKIYDPSFYFNEENKDRQEALNLLLLTQGWRRYVWNETNLKENNKHSQPFLYDTLIGRIQKKYTKKTETLGQKFVMVFTTDSLKSKDIITTDSIGRFIINHYHLKIAEQSYLYLKPITPGKSKYIINIKDSRFDIINSNHKTINYPFPKQNDETIEDTREAFIVSNKVTQLEEVIVTIKKKQIFRDKYLGTLDSLAKLEIDNTYVCAFDYLNCVNHPEAFNNKPVVGELYWNENRTRKTRYKIFTEKELLEKYNLKMLKGFYGKREFYEPVHDKETINDPFPDYRNTLYWNPSIITDEKGEATITFFCSDINTAFIGNIEGVSVDGQLGRETFNFRVRKKE